MVFPFRIDDFIFCLQADNPIQAKMPQLMRHLWNNQIKLLAFLVFALLICDAAACLASRLARCLAFAATAVLCAFTKITSFDSFDVFHCTVPPFDNTLYSPYIITLFSRKSISNIRLSVNKMKKLYG